MTLKDLRELFYNGYDDKARINLATGIGDEILEDIRIISSSLDPYDDRKVVGLAQFLKVIEVIIE